MSTQKLCALSVAYGVTFALSVKDAALVFDILNGAPRIDDTYGDTDASHRVSGDKSRERMAIAAIRGPILTGDEWKVIRDAQDAKWEAERLAREEAKANPADA